MQPRLQTNGLNFRGYGYYTPKRKSPNKAIRIEAEGEKFT